jgi:NADH-quinone oxidoreductase subunit H
MAEMTQRQPERGGLPLKYIAAIVVVVIVAIVLFLIVSNAAAIGDFLNNAFNFVFNYESRVAPNEIVQCRAESGCSTIQAIVFAVILFFVVITGFAYTTLLERIALARLQHRVGPNRVGPFGLLQPAADGVKLIFKEDIVPTGAYKAVYLIAPILKAVPTFIVLAVIPLGPDLVIPWFDGRWYQVPLSLADPSVGVLWLLAITSLGTYGVVLAGWSSNNKYSMLGGLRASAQMLSYELSLGLTMAVPILLAGSMSLGDIMVPQRMIWQWYIFQNPLAAAVLFIALLAEVNRSPFDLPEAEQELTAGYMTEYSGMKFAAFMMAEYLGMIAISMIIAALYLGGYQDGFGLVQALPFLGPLVFIGKVVLLILFMIWIRGTLPRIRYDRLMTFGWKVMIPLALISVAWSAIAVAIGDATGSPMVYGVIAGILFVVIVAGGVWALTRAGEAVTQEAEEEDDLAVDPLITGVSSGVW